jgi:hypothetical protein
MGYEAMVDEVADLFLSGKKDEAGAAIPTALIDELSLIGPADKIRSDLDKWRESLVTTITVAGRHRRRARRRGDLLRLGQGCST